MNGTRLPENWQPDLSLMTWAKGRRPDLDIPDTIEQFKDYWCAKSGKDATKLDWGRTFRNWIRGAWARPGSVQTPSPPSRQAYKPERRMSDSERVGSMTKFADIFASLGIGK